MEEIKELVNNGFKLISESINYPKQYSLRKEYNNYAINANILVLDNKVSMYFNLQNDKNTTVLKIKTLNELWQSEKLAYKHNLKLLD